METAYIRWKVPGMSHYGGRIFSFQADDKKQFYDLVFHIFYDRCIVKFQVDVHVSLK